MAAQDIDLSALGQEPVLEFIPTPTVKQDPTFVELDKEIKEHDPDTTITPNFRIQGTKLLITYKGHWPGDIMLNGTPNQWGVFKGLNNIFANNHVDEFYFAHEVGQSTGIPYPHTHVAVSYSKKFDCKNARAFDIYNFKGEYLVHPNIRGFNLKGNSGKVAWIKAVRYLGKEDPRNKELSKYGQTTLDQMKTECSMEHRLELIRTAPTLNAAFDTATSFKDIQAIKTVYEARPPIFNFTSAYTALPWQQSLLDEVQSTSLFKLRKIIWYYDQKGGCGKSILCDIAEEQYGSKLMIFTNLSKISDLAHLISTRASSGSLPSVFFIDLSRANQDRDTVYSFTETLANGRLTSTKYNGAELRFKTEHIVIFANFMPDVFKMSLDRWDIRSLSKDSNHNVTVTNVSVDTAIKTRDQVLYPVPQLFEFLPGGPAQYAKASSSHS